MLTNPNPKTDWSVGDACFFREHWSERIVSGTILNIASNIAEVQGGPEFLGRLCQPLENLFPTKKEALEAAMAESRDKIKAYENEMPDAASIMQFAYTHVIASAEEYTDWEARTAYKNRVKAVMGITLD